MEIERQRRFRRQRAEPARVDARPDCRAEMRRGRVARVAGRAAVLAGDQLCHILCSAAAVRRDIHFGHAGDPNDRMAVGQQLHAIAEVRPVAAVLGGHGSEARGLRDSAVMKRAFADPHPAP